MTNNNERTPELFPTREELQSVFRLLLKGKEYKVVGTPRDDSFTIETIENGERVEYNYAKARYDYRNPSLNPEARFSASIHKITYDGDRPTGECAANYLDGHWEFPA